MAIPGTIKGKIVDAADYVGKFISTNGHAQQSIPAVHRLSAAGGMYLGWKGGDQIRDSVFANNQISEGEFVEKKKEEIPAPLRFMYHSIDWNPHSDAPSDQWKKILYQAMPAIGAAVGTVAGSSAVFQFNGRAANYAKYKNPATTLSVLQADDAALYSESALPLIFTSMLGGASASSIVGVLLFGFSLNAGFYPRNGNAINLGNNSGGNLAASKALAERISKIPFYITSAEKSNGKISPEWAKIFVSRVYKNLFPKHLDTAKKEAEAADIVHNELQKSYDQHKALGLEGCIKSVSKEIKEKLADIAPTYDERDKILYHGHDKFFQEKLGFKVENAVLGNSSPRARSIRNHASNATGIGKDTTPEAFESHLIRQEKMRLSAQQISR